MKLIRLITKVIYFFMKLITRSKYWTIIKSNIKDIERTSKVLNIGSGGLVQDFLMRQGFKNLTSIDLDIKRNPDFIMNVEKMTFVDNTFDVVFIFEVLEHVENPNSAFNEIYRVLKDNGTLVGSTPFIIGIHDAPYDYWRFTKYGLKKYLKIFKEKKIVERGGFFLTILVLLARMSMSSNYFLKLFGIIMLPFIIIFLPLSKILDILFPDDFWTVGYIFKAYK